MQEIKDLISAIIEEVECQQKELSAIEKERWIADLAEKYYISFVNVNIQ